MSLFSTYSRVYYLGGFLIFFLTISPLTIYKTTILEVGAYCLLLFLLFERRCINGYVSMMIQKVVLLFAFAFFIPAILHFQLPFLTDVLQWMVIIAVIFLHNDDRAIFLNVAIRCFTVVLFLALIEYIIGYVSGHVFIINSLKNGNVSFTQSLFNLYRYGNLHYRFSALSSEPGELGAICGFIVAFVPWTKKYMFPVIVNILGGLISLSLAFYIYLAFVLCLKFFAGKISLKYILAFLIMIGILSYTFKEQIQDAIFMRVAKNEHVDNRSAKQVNEFVLNIFNTSEGIYGVGNRTAYALQENSGHGNAGLKWKLFQYGYVGVGCYFWAMLILYREERNRNVPFIYGIFYFLLYFYSVGLWGVPLFMLLIFTTLDENDEFNEKYLC